MAGWNQKSCNRINNGENGGWLVVCQRINNGGWLVRKKEEPGEKSWSGSGRAGAELTEIQIKLDWKFN